MQQYITRRPASDRLRTFGLLAVLMGIIVLALTLAGQGDAPAAQAATQQQGNDADVVTTRILTDAEWTTASGAVTIGAGPYSNADIQDVEAGLYVDWSSLSSDGVLGWRLERRPVRADGVPIAPWNILKRSITAATTSYTDTDLVPGFFYSYRTTAITMTGPTTHVTAAAEAVSRQGVYAYAVANRRLKVVIQDPIASDRAYGVALHRTNDDVLVLSRIYLASNGHTLEVSAVTDSVQVGSVLQLKVSEYVQEGPNIFRRVGSVGDPILINVSPATVPAPASLFIVGTPGARATVDWADLTGIHRSQFSHYRVARRDAKQYGSEFETIAIHTTSSVVEPKASGGKHFQYQVQGIRWNGTAGPTVASAVTPAIPAPACNGSDSATAISLEPWTNTPTFQSGWAMPTRPHPDFIFHVWYGTDTTSNRSACLKVDPDDWYVMRKKIFHHGLSADCPDPSKSCNLLLPSDVGEPYRAAPPAGTKGYTHVPGVGVKMINRIGGSHWAWYDETHDDLTRGLHLYRYRVCSHYTPTICSTKPGYGPWLFVEIDSVPFESSTSSP